MTLSTEPGPTEDGTRAGGAPSEDDVRAATERARACGDPSRWPTKLPVRDRLAVLLDTGSFTEDGLLASARADDLPADGVVTGAGRAGPTGGRSP